MSARPLSEPYFPAEVYQQPNGPNHAQQPHRTAVAQSVLFQWLSDSNSRSGGAKERQTTAQQQQQINNGIWSRNDDPSLNEVGELRRPFAADRTADSSLGIWKAEDASVSHVAALRALAVPVLYRCNGQEQLMTTMITPPTDYRSAERVAFGRFDEDGLVRTKYRSTATSTSTNSKKKKNDGIRASAPSSSSAVGAFSVGDEDDEDDWLRDPEQERRQKAILAKEALLSRLKNPSTAQKDHDRIRVVRLGEFDERDEPLLEEYYFPSSEGGGGDDDHREHEGLMMPPRRSPRRLREVPEGGEDGEAEPFDSTALLEASQSLSSDPRPHATPPSRPRRGTLLRPNEKPVNERFRVPGRCDATNVRSAAHMYMIARSMQSAHAAAEIGRDPTIPIEEIDLSGTAVGIVEDGAPVAFSGEDGSPLRSESASSVATALWPQEVVELRIAEHQQKHHHHPPPRGGEGVVVVVPEITPERRAALSARSLCLSYIAPCLFLNKPQLFQVRVLIARRCELTGADAEALAEVLRYGGSDMNVGQGKRHGIVHVALEVLDLRDNDIDLAGATALCKAIKYKRIKSLLLEGNPQLHRDDPVMQKIADRLRNNADGIPNRGRFGTLFY